MPYHEDGPYEDPGTMIAEGLILYKNIDRNYSELTRYGEPLCSADPMHTVFIEETPGDYNDINQEYVCLYMGEKLLVIRSDTGELVYQTSEDKLVSKAYSILVFTSGNYLDFRDPNGNLVMKVFADQYSGE